MKPNYPSRESLLGELNAYRSVLVQFLIAQNDPDAPESQEMTRMAYANACDILEHWSELRRSQQQAFWVYEDVVEDHCPHKAPLEWIPSGARCPDCGTQIVTIGERE